MGKKIIRLKAVQLCLLLLLAVFLTNQVRASSHREAPLISMDPLADNTDVYAFRSPDDTSTVTLIGYRKKWQSPGCR